MNEHLTDHEWRIKHESECCQRWFWIKIIGSAVIIISSAALTMIFINSNRLTAIEEHIPTRQIQHPDGG